MTLRLILRLALVLIRVFVLMPTLRLTHAPGTDSSGLRPKTIKLKTYTHNTHISQRDNLSNMTTINHTTINQTSKQQTHHQGCGPSGGVNFSIAAPGVESAWLLIEATEISKHINISLSLYIYTCIHIHIYTCNKQSYRHHGGRASAFGHVLPTGVAAFFNLTQRGRIPSCKIIWRDSESG